MPRFLKPGKTFPVWLDSDGEIRFEERPALLARTLNGHEEDELFELQSSIDPARARTVRDALHKAMMFLFVGCQNMGEPLSPQLLRKFTTEEMMELIGKARAGNAPSEADLGKSASPPSFVAGGSVGPAPREPAASIPNSPAQSASPAPSARSPHPIRTVAAGTPETLPREMTDPMAGNAFEIAGQSAGSATEMERSSSPPAPRS